MRRQGSGQPSQYLRFKAFGVDLDEGWRFTCENIVARCELDGTLARLQPRSADIVRCDPLQRGTPCFIRQAQLEDLRPATQVIERQIVPQQPRHVRIGLHRNDAGRA